MHQRPAEDPASLLLMEEDGSGAVESILTSDQRIWGHSWSGDGEFLAFFGESAGSDFDIWLMRTDGESEPERILDSEFNESYPRFSPDGAWLAYYSDESGRGETYVRSFPNLGQRRETVSTEGSGTGTGNLSVWAHSGRELFYLSGNRMMAVDIETEPDLTVGTPRELFRTPFPVARDFEISPDGRFLLIRIGEQQSDLGRIHIVLNWHQELLERVPVP